LLRTGQCTHRERLSDGYTEAAVNRIRFPPPATSACTLAIYRCLVYLYKRYRLAIFRTLKFWQIRIIFSYSPLSVARPSAFRPQTPRISAIASPDKPARFFFSPVSIRQSLDQALRKKRKSPDGSGEIRNEIAL
jgi:hypothetical protein